MSNTRLSEEEQKEITRAMLREAYRAGVKDGYDGTHHTEPGWEQFCEDYGIDA